MKSNFELMELNLVFIKFCTQGIQFWKKVLIWFRYCFMQLLSLQPWWPTDVFLSSQLSNGHNSLKSNCAYGHMRCFLTFSVIMAIGSNV